MPAARPMEAMTSKPRVESSTQGAFMGVYFVVEGLLAWALWGVSLVMEDEGAQGWHWRPIESGAYWTCR